MADPATPPYEFPRATEAEWRALVAKSLGEKAFDSLTETTAEGLPIAPLYAPAASTAAPARPQTLERPWEVAVLTAHPDPGQANRELLTDLEGGAAAVIVRLDPDGARGVAVGSAEDLARTLDGVMPEIAPVALDAGFQGPQATVWLGSWAKASPAARLRFHLDPLSAFAQAGASPGPIEAHLEAAATAASRQAETYPQAQLFLASGRVMHEAGGGEAGEIAFAATAALAYARALITAGATPVHALGAITLSLAADTDDFLTIAKLRAARVVWARIATASGADPVARIEARSSHRMLTARDAWTNMVRLTIAGFGAAAGGADTVVLGQFTDALGHPTAFARRQSRNAQLILMEEAHVGRVADPAAGSGYVQALTDQFAKAAWSQLQQIETQGGLPGALKSGHVADLVAAARGARPAPRIIGVNAFLASADKPPEVEMATPRAVRAPSVRLPGPDSRCPPLQPMRLAQADEEG